MPIIYRPRSLLAPAVQEIAAHRRCVIVRRSKRAGSAGPVKGALLRRPISYPRRVFQTGMAFLSERQSSYSYEDLLVCGHGNLFGAGNAQLPLPPMLMFDRITRIADTGGEYGKGEIVAEFDIKPDLWFFSCHFEGDPVMPGCLGLDSLWQLTGFFLGWMGGQGRGRAIGVGEVKFSQMVLPTPSW